jgi:hypothetical protein
MNSNLAGVHLPCGGKMNWRSRFGVRGKGAESTTKASVSSSVEGLSTCRRWVVIDVSFPLTLSLSLGERETDFPRWKFSSAPSDTQRVGGLIPPAGTRAGRLAARGVLPRKVGTGALRRPRPQAQSETVATRWKTSDTPGLTQRGRSFSLSPRERAGVRGKDAEFTTKAPVFSSGKTLASFWRWSGIDVLFPTLSFPGERGADLPRWRILRAPLFLPCGRTLGRGLRVTLPIAPLNAARTAPRAIPPTKGRLR